jgi:polyhydroxyalkanoate synthesis regulator phasin
MSDINDTIAEVLRLDAEATPESAWDVIEQHAYYRTAAPALAREVLRLQREVERLQAEQAEARLVSCCDGHNWGYEDGHRAGQEAMREMAAAQVDREADIACQCDGTMCCDEDVPGHDVDCQRDNLEMLAERIRSLEVE